MMKEDQITARELRALLFCEWCVGSLTSHSVIFYEQGLWDSTSGL